MSIRAAVWMALVGVSLISCSARAPFKVVDRPDKLTCVSVDGHMGPDEVDPQLLFTGAEATLERSGRSFHVVFRTTTTQPTLGPGVVDIQTRIAAEGGLLCFEVLPGAAAGADTFDAVRVVWEADPALQRTLSPAARRVLESATVDAAVGNGVSR